MNRDEQRLVPKGDIDVSLRLGWTNEGLAVLVEVRDDEFDGSSATVKRISRSHIESGQPEDLPYAVAAAVGVERRRPCGGEAGMLPFAVGYYYVKKPTTQAPKPLIFNHSGPTGG